MRRFLAVVAAVAMVAASAVIRSRLDRHEEDAARTLRLVCAQELDDVCEPLAGDHLQLTVEPAGTTADRLGAMQGDAGLDGWLVPEPWPAIVDGRRKANALPPLFTGDRAPVARSPLVLVVWKDRATALGGRCGQAVTWKCLGDAAAAGPWTASGGKAEWGSPKLGFASPVTDGQGLLILGQAVAGWFGRTDLSTNDFDNDDAFRRWLSALARAVTVSATSPLQLMLTAGPAAYDAVGTVEAEAGPALAGAAIRDDLQKLYPAPMATADLVLAEVAGSPAASSLRRAVVTDGTRRDLADHGWRVPGFGSARGVSDAPPLPPTTDLPPSGLLEALRARWQEATR